MDKPTINTSLVYGTIAELLPTEGRDFTIDATYGENGTTRLIVNPLTAIGRAWVPFLEKELGTKMGSGGVQVAEGGVVSREVMTAASVRARIEAEADAAIKTKVAAAEAEHRSRFKEAQELRKLQVARDGSDSSPSDDVRNAYRASNDASIAAARARRIASKISGIRANVDAAALAAAKAEGKEGKNWAVDLHAPLTSLFDQQDVTNRMKAKEDTVYSMAVKAVELDDLRDSAVSNLKPYVLQKEV